MSTTLIIVEVNQHTKHPLSDCAQFTINMGNHLIVYDFGVIVFAVNGYGILCARVQKVFP